MAVSTLTAPTGVGDTIRENGVDFISWDGSTWHLYKINQDNPQTIDLIEVANALLSIAGSASFVRETTEGYVVKELNGSRYTLVYSDTGVAIYESDGTITGLTPIYTKLFVET